MATREEPKNEEASGNHPFDLPTTTTAGIKDITWITGRFWVTHHKTIPSMIHVPTSFGIAFGSYLFFFAIAVCIYRALADDKDVNNANDYNYILYIGICFDAFFALLFVLHSLFSRSLFVILFMTIYHSSCVYLTWIMFGNIYLNESILFILITPLAIAFGFALFQVIIVHKLLLGRWPTDSDPEWFPQIFDIITRQMHAVLFLIVMLGLKHELYWMGGIITKKNRDKAIYCKQFYSERQYACCPCCENESNIK